MPRVRLAALAQVDIEFVLTESEQGFGPSARKRYGELIGTAIRELARHESPLGLMLRPDLGPAVEIFHLFHVRKQAAAVAGLVRRPRHHLVLRREADGMLLVARLLHEAMDIQRHYIPDDDES